MRLAVAFDHEGQALRRERGLRAGVRRSSGTAPAPKQAIEQCSRASTSRDVSWRIVIMAVASRRG